MTEHAPSDREPEVERLLRALRRTAGFRLFTVAVDDPHGAEELLSAVAASGAVVHRVHFDHSMQLSLESHGALLTERLLAPLIDPARIPLNASIVALDLANALPRDEPVWLWLFERLNERRNVVTATVRRPLLLLASNTTLHWFAGSSPDFWSVVSAHFDCAPAGEATVHPPTPRGAVSAREVGALLREAAALEESSRQHAGAHPEARAAQMLEAFERRAAAAEAMPGDPTLRDEAVRSAIEASESALQADQPDRALVAMERAAPLASAADGALRARAWRALAHLHDVRGDTTRAQRYRDRAEALAEPPTTAAPTAGECAVRREAPTPNGAYRREACVARPALEKKVAERLWEQRQPTALVGAHGCGKSWLLDRALDGRTTAGRRVHVDLDALPRAPR